MLIKKGAEASLYLESWQSHKVIQKRRLPKHYRVSKLDDKIRSYRTAHEPQLMHRAKEAGVATPTIFMVDKAEGTITMEYVEGQQVKQVLNSLSSEERVKLCRCLGELIGRLHSCDVIHGDLTTSNMILTRTKQVYFVDFGLGELRSDLESKGVDLHLLKRAFQSTHYRFADECFKSAIKGYSKIVGQASTDAVLEKIREIEARGRYIKSRKEQAI